MIIEIMAIKRHKRIRPKKSKNKQKKCEHEADKTLTIEAEAPTPPPMICTKKGMKSYKSEAQRLKEA